MWPILRPVRPVRLCSFRRVAVMIWGLAPIIAAAQSPFHPPADARIVTLNGQQYYSGEVYLPDHADTLALTALGFRNFQFEGRSVGTVIYRALWPVKSVQAEMPQAVSGFDYDQGCREFPSSNYSSPISDGNPSGPEEYSIIRHEVLTSSQWTSPSGPGWQNTRRCDEVWMSKEEYRKLLEEYDTRRTAKGSKTPANVLRDPRITGAFRVSPIESGPFHKPESVGTRDPNTTGSFTITPIETTQRSSLEVHDWSNGNPYTGSMNWGVSDYQPSDGWRGVGFHPLPPEYSVPYWPSIQVPRNRR
jgi:hypothetical protein